MGTILHDIALIVVALVLGTLLPHFQSMRQVYRNKRNYARTNPASSFWRVLVIHVRPRVLLLFAASFMYLLGWWAASL
jgi:hypothetical protein